MTEFEQNPQLTAEPEPAPETGAQTQETQPPPAREPERPKKIRQRRVGTLTMGFCLIVTGVLLVCGLVLPEFDLLGLMKWAPVVLIFLGVEIIVSSLLMGGDRIKYDFLSMFVCFVLIVGSCGLAVAAPLWENYGPRRERVQTLLSDQLTAEVEQRIKGFDQVSGVWSRVYLDWYELPEQPRLEELTGDDYARITIELRGPFEDQEAFAAACADLFGRLQGLTVRFSELTVTYGGWRDDGHWYRLEISHPMQLSLSAAELAARAEGSDLEDEDPDDRDGYEEESEAVDGEDNMVSQIPNAASV